LDSLPPSSESLDSESEPESPDPESPFEALDALDEPPGACDMLALGEADSESEGESDEPDEDESPFDDDESESPTGGLFGKGIAISCYGSITFFRECL
jgi:hypothetical protein